MSRIRPIVEYGGAFAALLLAWWYASGPMGMPPYLLPSPQSTAAALVREATAGNLAGHLGFTLRSIGLGLALGAFAGVALAYLLYRVPLLSTILDGPLVVLQTAPKIAIAPLLLLWLGLGPAPKIVLVAIVTFFPVMTGVLSGLRFLPRSYVDLARVLRLSAWQRFRHIELPATLPTLLAGMTVASTLAITAVVIGELMGANQGIGYLLAAGQESADTATVIGMVLLLSLLGWVLYEVFEWVRRRTEERFSHV